MIKYLKKENFDEEIKSGVVLVDFSADAYATSFMRRTS